LSFSQSGEQEAAAARPLVPIVLLAANFDPILQG
jgi:putative tryptophan/tyrosine transport system substrate-binding protein